MASIKHLADINLVNISKIINVPTPSVASDVANKGYVDEYIQGLAWKDEVVASPVGNIDITSPGTAFDGVTLALGDRVLLKEQTDPAENGIYLFDTSTTSLVRSNDANSIADLKQAIVTVTGGTINGGTTWRQSTTSGVLDTDDIVWFSFGVVTQTASETVEGKAEIATQAEVDAGIESGAKFVTPATLANTNIVPHIYAVDVGNGSDTSITVTHNLGTKDVILSVFDNTTPFAEVDVTVEHTSTNVITLQFNTAPTTNQYRTVVLG